MSDMDTQQETHPEASPLPEAHLNRLQRWVGNPWFWVGAIALVFSLVLLRIFTMEVRQPPPVLSTVAPFSLMNQRGEDFGTKQLDGRLWVAGVVCTQCDGKLDHVLTAMQSVQDRTRQLGDAFHVVAISVEPEVDTFEALKSVAKERRASKRAWLFLRGDANDTRVLLRDLFEEAQVPEAGGLFPANPYVLVLVDGYRRVRGRYDVTQEGSRSRLMSDLGLVANLPE